MAASPKNAAPSFSRLENACEGKNVEPHWTPYLPTECRKLTAASGHLRPLIIVSAQGPQLMVKRTLGVPWDLLFGVIDLDCFEAA